MRTKRQFLKQTFEARPFPSVIVIDDHYVVGPFCVHCGNPYSMHGWPDSRCPNQHLHPLFPSPNLSFEDEAGISRAARTKLRELRGRSRKSIIAAAVPEDIRNELLAQGYVEQRGPWLCVT